MEQKKSLEWMKDLGLSDVLSNRNLDLEFFEQILDEELMSPPEIEYVFESDNPDPEYHYLTDSGFDLRANKPVMLQPLERALIPTGLYLDLPPRTELQVRTKSGLAIKRGLMVLNSPGTVDGGYTGEIQVILINLSQENQEINVGDKIAQAVLSPVYQGGEVRLKKVDKLRQKDRNANGFGSTGN